MVRFYLTPIERKTDTKGTHRGPKYFAWPYDPDPPPLAATLVVAMKDYGDEDLMLVAADVTDAENAAIVAMTDVTKMADNLDDQIGANLASVQNALELLNLPAQMLTASVTYRTMMRGINAVMDIAGCMQGKGFNVFAPGVTLSTTLGSLSVAARQALQACAVQFGYDQTGITLASTVRQVFTLIVQQARPFVMLDVTV